MLFDIDIYIDIDLFINCNWVFTPVAVHIYTQTILSRNNQQVSTLY